MYELFKKLTSYVLGAFLAGYITAMNMASELKITKPTEKDIMYGQETVHIFLFSDLKEKTSRVDFYLGQYPNPICIDIEPPYECEFNAGKEFESRKITVRTYDKNGNLLAEDSVRTRAFTKPVRVIRHTLDNVPVRVNYKGEEELDLSKEDFNCLFGGNECEVVGVKKLSEASGVNSYLDVLMDVSSSMNYVGTVELRKALEYAIDKAPPNTKMRLSTFSGYNSLNILTDYTPDKRAIKDAMEKIGSIEGKTCLFDSTEELMKIGPYDKGTRRLLLITDCMDTCDGIMSRDSVLKLSKESGVVIDVLRTRGRFRDKYLARACEGLATETNGNIFKGEVTSLHSVMEKIVSEMNETYLLDIDLPDNVKKGREARLQLKPKTENVHLKYPEYWIPGLLDSVSMRMLDSLDPFIRHRAIKRLSNNDDPKIMRELIKAYGSEYHPILKEAELVSIYNMIGSNLLHKKDLKSQRLAIHAAEDLHNIDSKLIEPIKPFLKTYMKTGPPKKLKKRAKRLID